MNDIHVTVTGWVARNPELRVTKDDSEWTTLRVGSTPRRRNADGDWVDGVTQWFDVKVWGKFARNVTKSIRSGDPVIVTGRMFTEEWESDQGTRTSQVIHASSVGHDLVRGTADFVRVRYESPDGAGEADEAGEGAAGAEPPAADRAPEPAF